MKCTSEFSKGLCLKIRRHFEEAVSSATLADCTSSIQFLYFMRYLAENKNWKGLPLGSVQESFNEHLT